VNEPKPSEEQDDAEDQEGPGPSSSITLSGLKQVTLTQDPIESDKVVAPSSGERGNDPYIGKTVDGRYRVEAQLGEGGMGVVYRCRHTIIDKQVAMKVLRADMARNEEVTERFLNEARSASSIGNPHIIDISDFGRLPDNSTYFIMEFLTGTSLAALVESHQPLPPVRAAHITVQLTEGLSEAHKAGIVHRDLKPDNIFLIKRGSQEDFVKILDFGIAKAATNNTRLTQAGQVFGTPHYMSPEQASGSPVDHRSDIYALGVILYEMTTGHLPFDADNFMAILTQHMYKSPVPPSKVDGLTQELPPGLEDVILRCLAKEPDERYQTMKELRDDIERVFAGQIPSASRDRRSITDGYSSPEEYFERRSASSAPGPLPKSNVPLYASIGIAAALAAGTVVYFATKSAAPPGAQAETASLVAQERAEDSQSAEQNSAQESPKTTRVAIAVAPLSAHVFDGDKDLGQSPVMVEVGAEPLTLTARLLGYEDRELSIDGSQEKVSVELVRSKKKKTDASSSMTSPSAVTSPSPKPRPSGDSGLVDPWD
jgi:serine/threonine protein kinase